MRRFYKVNINNTEWEIPTTYMELEAVGSGAYGQVVKTKLQDREQKLAIKKIAHPFQSTEHSKRTYRELRLLKHMDHENIIGLFDVFQPGQPANAIENFKEIYFVTHLMDTDLNNIIRTQKLSDEHVQFLIYQILRGLKYIHSAGIIHRDLKPSNIGVNEDCGLRILDFGLARLTEPEMTGYVATRWYRAPEIMLNWMHYNQTVDVWSVGCIMAEMLTGRTLFAGTDHIHQLNLILELLGTPAEELMTKISSENARSYIRALPPMHKRDFYEIFCGVNPLAVDLLEKMLELDADNRIAAEEALKHAYFRSWHDPADEPISSPYDASFEDFDLSVDKWKELVFNELLHFNSERLE